MIEMQGTAQIMIQLMELVIGIWLLLEITLQLKKSKYGKLYSSNEAKKIENEKGINHILINISIK